MVIGSGHEVIGVVGLEGEASEEDTGTSGSAMTVAGWSDFFW